jgi:DNA polymerase (family 10)
VKTRAVSNQEIAEVFDEMAGLLEAKGDSIFKIRAYQRAARVIEGLPRSLDEAVRVGDELKGIPGIGEAIRGKIHEYVTTGRVSALEALKAELPDGVLQLMNVPGIGPKTAMLIAREAGVSTVEGVEKAIAEGRLQQLPRMGAKTAENILRNIRTLRTKDRRIPLGMAMPVVDRITGDLRERCPALEKITPGGSVRRWQETVGDIDMMATTDDAEQVVETLVSLPYVTRVLGKGVKKTSVILDNGLQVDMRIIDKESFGAMLQHFTGDRQHNIQLRDYANSMGLSLSEYGITDMKTGKLEKFTDEEAFYHRLGMDTPPPEIRSGRGEIELARKHALPRLVEVGDIHGDLHVHSDWSDGRAPIEVMMEAAEAFGHQYVALTDHSSGRGVANGLTEERLRSQIRILRSMRGMSMKVLCGSEVDIRADGTLDYPDELLSKLDVVVASVHSAMAQPEERMTERIIRAMRNPHVTVIGHPTTRLLGSREPVQADMEALYRAAAETGTAMEINASPERLDLNDTHVMRAKELGVPLVISTDSHSTGGLEKLRYGVAMARRGWCEAKHILNTMPLEDFMRIIKTPKPERMRVFRKKMG